MKIKYINRYNGSIEFENPPGEVSLNFLYNSLLGKSIALPLLKRKFISDQFGKYMSSSISKSRIKPFVDSLQIDMSESEKEIEDFKSFNDFFYRKLKSSSRIIGDGLISPGDGRLFAFNSVSEVRNIYIKGERFSLLKFLKSEKLAQEFENSSIIILRLAPNDYHRYHFPFQGVPSISEKLEGRYYSVSPIALRNSFSKVFHDNKKEICRLVTSVGSHMLIVPVGATMVGSINSTYIANNFVEKGEEMGYFAFGGSTIVLLIDRAYFKLDDDLLFNTKNQLETKVRMGESIGHQVDR